MADEATAISTLGEVDLPVLGPVRDLRPRRVIVTTAIRVVHSVVAIATCQEVAAAAPATTAKGDLGPPHLLPLIPHGPTPGAQLLADLAVFQPARGVARSRGAEPEARQENRPESGLDPHIVGSLAARGPRIGVGGVRGLDLPGPDLSRDRLLDPGPGRPTVDHRQ